MQLIKKLDSIFKKQNIFLRPYEIIVTSPDSGFIEFIPDTISIDQLKKKYNKSLREIYKILFEEFEES